MSSSRRASEFREVVENTFEMPAIGVNVEEIVTQPVVYEDVQIRFIIRKEMKTQGTDEAVPFLQIKLVSNKIKNHNRYWRIHGSMTCKFYNSQDEFIVSRDVELNSVGDEMVFMELQMAETEERILSEPSLMRVDFDVIGATLLEEYAEESSTSNVVLLVDGHEVYGNREILSLHSKFFKSFLQNRQGPIRRIELPNECKHLEILHLLSHITGKTMHVHHPMHKVRELMSLGDKYECPMIRDKIIGFFELHPGMNNEADMHGYAEEMDQNHQLAEDEEEEEDEGGYDSSSSNASADTYDAIPPKHKEIITVPFTIDGLSRLRDLDPRDAEKFEIEFTFLGLDWEFNVLISRDQIDLSLLLNCDLSKSIGQMKLFIEFRTVEFDGEPTVTSKNFIVDSRDIDRGNFGIDGFSELDDLLGNPEDPNRRNSATFEVEIIAEWERFQCLGDRDFELKTAPSDVTLNVDGTDFFVHEKILSTYSILFHEKFFEGRLISLNELTTDVTEIEFSHFLAYFYNKFSFVDEFNVDFLLPLAEKFQVRHLKDMCEHFLCTSKLPIPEKLLRAERFGLKMLRHRVLQSM